MIKRKKKVCVDCGEERYIFSKGRCELCARKASYKAPNRPIQPLSRKSNGKIPLRTKKRSEQEKTYRLICEEMDKVKVKTCFFCGDEIEGRPDHHHLIGRDGDALTLRKYIVHAHRKCHDEYHTVSVKKITWFLDFINRLSDLDVGLAEKEMEKYNK